MLVIIRDTLAVHMDSLENSLGNPLKNPLCIMTTTINTHDNQCCGYVVTSTMLHTWFIANARRV